MKPTLNHVAFSVEDIEWHIHFFEEVFEMTTKKVLGNSPNRKIWMNQGIQLIESPKSSKSIWSDSAILFDHIAFTVSFPTVVIDKAIHLGCTQVATHPLWFSTPSGIVIELLEC